MSTHHDMRHVWRARQEMGGTDHPGWRLNNLTTTQRGALTGSGAAKAGDVIWNTTNNTLDAYNGTTWESYGGFGGTVGTVTTAATTSVEEYGFGPHHFTKLTMTSFAVGITADNASLGIGAKFYTFPAGTIAVKSVSLVGGLTAAISVTTNTPEVGVGSVIASGAVSVLSGTATFEDFIDGNVSGTGGDTVAPDVAGGTFYKSSSFTSNVVIKTTGGKARDLFLNAAAAWVDVTAAGALTFTGVVTIEWAKVS